MDMLIGGTWRPAASGRAEEVTSPFDGAVIGTVPVAGADDVRAALDHAEQGAVTWRRTPAFERMRIMMRAAELADERAEQTAQIISAEAGKTITEARGEASRSGDLIRLAAFEGTQLYGDALPLDANRGTGLDKLGFTIHQPVGIVAAITPFNYPALLVMHKLAPALAAGNAVVLKPARTTPLTALALARCFTDAGLPDGVLSVLTGPGGSLGDALVTDPRVRKISFTGSTATGQRITQVAGIKKLSLELGSSCPVVVLPDADIELAAAAVAAGGYVNAGQVCISVQRVITHPAVGADFLDALVPKVEAIRTGDPRSAETTMGTLITAAEAERVEGTIRQRRTTEGAKLLTGGERDGADRAPGRGRRGRPAVGRSARTSCSARPWRSARPTTGKARSPRPTARPTVLGAGHLHLRRGGRRAGHPRDRRRHRAHQLDPAVAGRPHALRRPEGERHRQGRPPLGGGRDDRHQDRHPARPAVVAARLPSTSAEPRPTMTPLRPCG